MAKDVTGASRVNMFEQIKSPNGTVYEPVSRIGNRVTYRVKGTDEKVECGDGRKDGETLDMLRGYEHSALVMHRPLY